MSTRKYPTPFYAAAGAGEVIVEELRKLPGRVEEFRDRNKLEERANAVRDAVRDNVKQGVATLRGLDSDKLRRAAEDTAATLGVKAREAREKAGQTYAELVERGQNVANGERSPIKVIATIAQGDTTARGTTGSSATGRANGTTKANGTGKANGTTKANGTATKSTAARTTGTRVNGTRPTARKVAKKTTTSRTNGRTTK